MDYPYVDGSRRQEQPLGRSSTTSPSGTPRSRSLRRSTASRTPASTGPPARVSPSPSQRHPHPAEQGARSSRAREAGREGAGPVREGSHHRRRASSGAHRDLDRGHRRGRRRPCGRTSRRDNTINRMVVSGARGNWLQVRNIAGMRGLVNNPKGEIIPRPIISTTARGCRWREYFIATHGARKGLADTALRTADSGYLTRRLVDVSQDVIIREDDCGTERGLDHADRRPRRRRRAASSTTTSRTQRLLAHARERRRGRRRGHRPRPATTSATCCIDKLLEAGVETHQGPLGAHLRVRASASARSCYGRSLATGKLVDIGEAVGIIAAQSIGEPGTQLTMRTFHTGGVGVGRRHHAGSAACPGALRGPHPQGCVADRGVRRSHHDRGDRPCRVASSSRPTTATSRIAYPVTKRSTPAGRGRRARRASVPS